MPVFPRRRSMHRVRAHMGDIALALVTYVPLLLTHRGKLGADTKSYLYLDPAKLLSKAPYLWDPSVGLGTVTHQNIGYLFPMGPYYWAMERLGLPDWVAQRIWMGSIMFLAGLGVRYLLRTLQWHGAGATVASFAYALSPYSLHYIYKHSVILLPFTALPWMIALTARSLRQPGWRHPAAFALVAVAAGGINATSLLLVLIGPALWVVHAVFIEKEISLRAAFAPLARIGVLTVATSLWWVAGLSLQGRFGIDILRFTETYRTVSSASSSSEITRGLGYWFFYGTDRLGPWFKAAITLTQSVPALTLTFAIPMLGVAAALWTRFRYRIFFVALALAGLIVSVGAHPFDAPSPYGAAFKALTSSSSGLALRSTPRAIPLLALAVAVFLGGAVASIARRRPALRVVVADVAILLITANLSPLWMGRMIDPFLERDEDVPSYWVAAGKALDAGDRATRALEIPGIDFANYRWGATVDPITPGLTDRDFAARELVPYGSPASADLMNAIDAPFQDGTFDPSSYAALLRTLGVGQVVLRNDTQYERFGTPRPRPMAGWMRQVDGLGTPQVFGPVMPHRGPDASPFVDENDLSSSPRLSDPHAVEIYPVTAPLPIVRTLPTQRPVIVAGSGAGLVTSAEAGLLPTDRLVVYSGSVSNDRAALRRLLDQGAELVVTDTNRRAARRWGSTTDNDGYLEMADETPTPDVSDNRIDLFGRDASTQTVDLQAGLRVTASAYGNPFTYTASDRGAEAFDGDPTTEWKVGAFDDVDGEWVQASSTAGPITLDHIELGQANRLVNRWITRARLTFDGRRSIEVTLGKGSRFGTQRVDVGSTTFTTLRITVLETDKGVPASYQGLSGVGFREVGIDGRHVVETVRPPTDLLDAVGDDAASHPLSFVLRRRSTANQIQVEDEERAMRRELAVRQARSFAVSGKARLNVEAPASTIDALLRPASASGPAPTFSSSSLLIHDIAWRSSKAFDGDPATAWQSQVNPVAHEWVDVTTPARASHVVSSITLMTDGRHSVPRRVHFEVDGVAQPAIALTASSRGDLGGRTTLQIPPQRLEGSRLRLVVDEMTPLEQRDRLSDHPSVMPLGIAEIGFEDATGAAVAPLSPKPSATFTTGCRTDLLSVGDNPVPVVVSGSTVDVDAGALVDVAPCDAAARVELGAGRTVLASVDGRRTGINLDQVVLSSPGPSTAPTTGAAAPSLRTTRDDKVGYTIRPDAATQPYWLVLGQSFNAGWELRAGDTDLGAPTLVNGYANAWLIDPATVGAQPVLHLDWTPQSTVWWALLLSGLGFVVCLVLALRPAKAAVRGTKLTMQPELISLGDAFGHAPGVATLALATVGAAAGGALFVGWWCAPVYALAMALALRTDLGWKLLRIACVGAIGAAAAYVVVKQAVNGYHVDFDWPKHFEDVHPVAMAGYCLLGVECTVEVIRAGWRRNLE